MFWSCVCTSYSLLINWGCGHYGKLGCGHKGVVIKGMVITSAWKTEEFELDQRRSQSWESGGVGNDVIVDDIIERFYWEK